MSTLADFAANFSKTLPAAFLVVFSIIDFIMLKKDNRVKKLAD